MLFPDIELLVEMSYLPMLENILFIEMEEAPSSLAASSEMANAAPSSESHSLSAVSGTDCILCNLSESEILSLLLVRLLLSQDSAVSLM